MPLMTPIDAHCAGMGRRGWKRAEYVFYYNYVTRFSAVFIVIMYEETSIGASKRYKNDLQKRCVKDFGEKCE